MDLSFILNELGENRTDYFNAIAPPIIQSSNFDCQTVEQARKMIQAEHESFLYTRGINPTVSILNEKLASLEQTEAALTVASGASAMALPILANVNQGDHIICVEKPYHWTNVLLTEWLPRFGVSCTFVDGKESSNFEKAIQKNTKIIVLESPNSFTYELQDLDAVSEIAQAHNLITIIDNSYNSPIFLKPARYGIDIVVHSATKYIGGHSDVVAGAICASQEMINKIFYAEYMTLGTIIAPFDAWLLLRGLRTLEIRMERVYTTSKYIVEQLADHSKIEHIYYPMHQANPQYELAQEQLMGCGGLFTLALKVEDAKQVENFCNELSGFKIAVSWGGHESLIFPACAKYSCTDEANKQANFNQVRFYVGLENPEYLLERIILALTNI